MKMTWKTGIIAAGVFFAAILAFTGSAYSQGKGMKGMDPGSRGGIGGGMGPGLDNPRIIQELGLSDEQVSKIREIRTGAMKEKIQAGANIKLLRLDLMNLLDQDNPDLRKIDDLIDKIGKEEIALEKQMIRARIKGLEILTDEQKKKAKSLMAGKMKGMGKERGMKGGSKKGGPGAGPGKGMGPGMHPGEDN